MKDPLAILWISAALLAGAADTRAADPACPDERPTTGQYRNYSYGFTVMIPKGLEGWWNSPRCAPDPAHGCVCMGDHGRDLPLNGGGFIFINADPGLDETLATAAYGDLKAFEAHTDKSELRVREFGQRQLRKMPSYRYIATSLEDGAAVVRESVHITLPSGCYVVVSIEAPEQQYLKYRRAYVSLLDSLRPSPRN